MLTTAAVSSRDAFHDPKERILKHGAGAIFTGKYAVDAFHDPKERILKRRSTIGEQRRMIRMHSTIRKSGY